MFRLTLMLFVGLAFAGCASSEVMKDLAEKRRARIEAAKIPDAELSEEQTAKLQALVPRAQIVWVRAGRQSDGKIFVCHVTTAKTLFGGNHVGLYTGTFEPDGSYQRSPALLWGLRGIQEDCRTRGFEPPVTITTNVTVMRI